MSKVYANTADGARHSTTCHTVPDIVHELSTTRMRQCPPSVCMERVAAWYITCASLYDAVEEHRAGLPEPGLRPNDDKPVPYHLMWKIEGLYA